MKAWIVLSVAFCSFLIRVNAVFSQGLTFATNTISPVSFPWLLVAADVNGDGKMDLVSEGSYLTVLTNNGNGGFGITNIAQLVIGEGGLAVADINGDGKPDLIAVSGNLILTIATNSDNNSFISQRFGYLYPGGTAPFPSSPIGLATLASNNDGKPDLIVVNFSSPGYLTVLTNGGSRFFGIQTNYIVGNNPRCVVAVDVNGDGYADLVTANSGDGTLTVLTNNGSGIFGSNATLNVGAYPDWVTAADVNGDGSMDLITANASNDGINYNGDTLTVFTNNGSGVFGSNATLTVGGEPLCVTAADINGDGFVDLVSANYQDNTLTVLTNNGSGAFGFNTTLNVGREPQCVVAADINGDGKMDLVSANSIDSTLTVLTQTNAGPPMLTVASSSSNSVVVSWPMPTYEPSPDFVLQTNSDLTTTNWGLADYLLSTNGSTESVTVNPWPSENLFFRLMSR